MPITKQLFALFLGALLVQPLFANIQSGMQWDVRTTGNDANGGGFDPTVTSPGTDYSQQASAQVAFTDLIIGSTTTQLTSVLDAFGATSPGNVINITGGSGCTTGWFEILSVSGSTATMDRAVGTAASVCTGNLGGSLATVTQGSTNATASTVATAAYYGAGNTVNIKAGTYTTTTALIVNLANTTSVTFTGYNTTHGDGGAAPLITTATNSTTLFSHTGCGTNPQCVIYFNNLSLSNTAGTPSYAISPDGNNGTTIVVNRVTMDGFSVAIPTDQTELQYSFLAVILLNSEIKNTTLYCIAVDQNHFLGFNDVFTGLYISGSYLHGNLNGAECLRVYVGANMYSPTVTLVNSVIANSAGPGINGAGAEVGFVTLINCVVANNAGSGIQNLAIPLIVNSIFYGNGGYGVDAVANTATAFLNSNNAYGSNTSGDRNNLAVGAGDVSLSANPFTSSSNFALNATAGGGAALKAHGTPGLMPAGTGYIDIGALQSQCTGGGGGSPTACSFSSLLPPAGSLLSSPFFSNDH